MQENTFFELLNANSGCPRNTSESWKLCGVWFVCNTLVVWVSGTPQEVVKAMERM